MKTLITALVTASLVLPLALDAPAQPRDTQRERQTDMQRDTDRDKQRQAWTKPADVVESRRLIGAKVRGADGKDIGEIDQLLVKQDDGKISHVVIGMGGLAGIGETKVVVPWSDVQVRRDREGGDRWIVSVDRAALDKAPRYEARDGRDRSTSPAASPGTSPRSGQMPRSTDDKK